MCIRVHTHVYIYVCMHACMVLACAHDRTSFRSACCTCGCICVPGHCISGNTVLATFLIWRFWRSGSKSPNFYHQFYINLLTMLCPCCATAQFNDCQYFRIYSICYSTKLNIGPCSITTQYYKHTHTHTHTHTHMHTHTHTCGCQERDTYTHACMHARTHANTHYSTFTNTEYNALNRKNILERNNFQHISFCYSP